MPNWPRLTETLTGPREPGRCQSCGAEAAVLWDECDQFDRPEAIYLWLCRPCSDKLIEAHPRLYISTGDRGPAPGAMLCCAGCRHNEQLRCGSPLLKANGGPGLAIRVNQVGFACSRGKGGGCRPIYDGPPQCDGRVLLTPDP